MVLWNGKTNDCYLEGYQKLDEVEFSELSTIINHKTDGIHLRQANLGFFNINRGNQVRCLRDIWNSQEGCSSQCVYKICCTSQFIIHFNFQIH